MRKFTKEYSASFGVKRKCRNTFYSQRARSPRIANTSGKSFDIFEILFVSCILKYLPPPSFFIPFLFQMAAESDVLTSQPVPGASDLFFNDYGGDIPDDLEL